MRSSPRQLVVPRPETTRSGVVYKPNRPGPFPVILWNHGLVPRSDGAFDELGPTFVAHGWAFFGPFRRGHGSSAAAGPYILDEIDGAGKTGGLRAKVATTIRLLAGDHLDAQLAVYSVMNFSPSRSSSGMGATPSRP